MTVKKKGDFEFDKMQKKYERFKRKIPNILGTMAENHFKGGFSKSGGQTNDSKGGWKDRVYTKGVGKRNILVDTGTLQKDIAKRKVSFRETVVGTSNLTKDYAEIQNEGGRIKITEAMRKFFWAKYYDTKDVFWKNMALTKKTVITIPKREYIGNDSELERKLLVTLLKSIKKFM